jgi:hypothetical protein
MESGVLIETRRYFNSDGRVWRIEKIEDTAVLRAWEFLADGTLRRITSFDAMGDWIWEKTINPVTGHSRLSINRDNFLFFDIAIDLIGSIEKGKFIPGQMLDIKWEGVREAILEILGAAKVVPELPMTTVDSLGPNRLLKMEWKDRWGEPRMDPWCFLELHCTTIGKVSYLRVPPIYTDSMSAIAWTFGMDKEDYQLEMET